MNCLPSSCFFYWEKLPNEMKMKIIQKMDNNTRLSLKICSFNSQQLVEAVPFRAIHKLKLAVYTHGEISMIITENICAKDIVQHFDSFLELQNKFEEELRTIDCIFTLEVYLKPTPTPNKLNITKNGELLKVRELIFTNYTDIASDLLSQVDPFYLKKLELYENSNSDCILETQQVKQVPLLSAYGKHMTDEQLLSLNSSGIVLKDVNDITAAGINQYIKKCLLKMENGPISFRIKFLERRSDFEEMFQGIQFREMVWDSLRKWKYSGEHGVIRMSTNSKKFELEIWYHELQIKGITIAIDQPSERNQNQNQNNGFQPTHHSTFKSLNYLAIAYKRMKIIEKYSAAVVYVFESENDLQEKLLEEISKINYIKHLRMKSTARDYDLCPFKKPITVGRFSIRQYEFGSDLLSQFEPIHLKEITLSVEVHIEKIFDMPQFIHAQKFEVYSCLIQDQQLLNTHATCISIHTGDDRSLTDYGINKFIKKMLANLNRHDYDFFITDSESARNMSDCLKGLDFTIERKNERSTDYIVNSPFSNFKLQIFEFNNFISGSRKTVSDM